MWDPYAGLSEGLKGEIALAYLRRARLGCSLEELFARLLPFGAARLLQAFGAYAKLSAADGKLSFKRFLPVAAERLSKIFEEGALSSFTALRGLADELSGRLGGGAWRL